MITFIRVPILALIALAATGCTIPLRQARDEAPPPANDPLDARLERCSTLGAENVDTRTVKAPSPKRASASCHH
jgi:conjugative transfer region protein TrbK